MSFTVQNFDAVASRMTPYIILLCLELFLDVCSSATQADVDKHLELGKEFLAKGKLHDALTHYHEAVDGDPNNYLTYYKRGTVYLALGKAKNALSDLDRVLELNPDFTPARVTRGNVHLKLGNYDLAQLDFYNVLKVDPSNQDANELLQKIDPSRERYRLAKYYFGNNDHPSAIQLITEAIETSPWAIEFYELRSEMHMESGNVMAAVSDIRSCTKLQADNTGGYYKLATLLYQLGEATEALKSVRECLKLDPEHKDCFPLYKSIKKVEKFLVEAEGAIEAQNYADCIAAAEKVLKNEKRVNNIIFEGKRLLCTCAVKDEQTTEALKWCTEALEVSQDQNLYCDRAEAYLQSELYDDAIRDFKAALEIDGHSDRAKEGLQRAEKLQKQSERRDYYKILEVKRSATKKEVVKAYRKMAQKWHPDNYQNDEKMKKIAEKKFIDIAAAKEVLTDEEKRRQFDAGEDPLDPESGKQHMPNFQHFQSFHGSPFQFRFHFN